MIPALDFVLAGRATFTVVSKRTGNHLTFRVDIAKDRQTKKRQDDGPWFVKVFRGGDNELSSCYDFIGTIFDGERFVYSRRAAKLPIDSVPVQTFIWLFDHLRRDTLPTLCEFKHEGRCGRCNHLLTDPASIERGLGPECVKHFEAVPEEPKTMAFGCICNTPFYACSCGAAAQQEREEDAMGAYA